MRMLYIETLYVTFIQDLQQHSLPLLDSLCSTLEAKDVYGACEKLCCQHVFLGLLLLPIVYFHSNHGDFIKRVSQLYSALMYPMGSDHTWGKIQTQYHHLLWRCYLTWPSHLSELRATTLYLISMEWVPFLCNIWSSFTFEHYSTTFFCLKPSSSYLNMASSLT